MKKLTGILLALILTVSSFSTSFVYAYTDDKNKKVDGTKKSNVTDLNDNVTGNSANQFEYAGNWSYGKQDSAYMGDNHWSKSKDAYYRVRFTGTQIRVYASKAHNHGIAAVSVDGGDEKSVDLFSLFRSDNKLIYESHELKDGVHTLKVRVTGKKNRMSGDCFVTADRVEITSKGDTPHDIVDPQAPTIPAGLMASAVSKSQINLSWTASMDNVGVKGYKVYRNGKQIGTVSGTSYCDKGLHSGTTYSYSVSAFDYAGNNSAQCSYITVKTIEKDTQAPTVPAGLNAAVVSKNQIDLHWAASRDNIGVKGYKVYRNGKQIGTVSNTSYSDRGLNPGTTYSYSVSAFDAEGNNSARCPAIYATTQQAQSANLALYKTASSDSQQQGYIASNGNDGNLSTMWCAADGNANHWWKVDLGGYFDLSGSEVTWQFGQKTYRYKIEVSTDSINWNLAVDKTNNSNTQITQADRFAVKSVRYVRIVVTGVPSECWAAFYEFKVFGTQATARDMQAPSIPSCLSASAISTSKVSLKWNASTDNVGVAGYRVFRNGVQIGTVKNSTSYTDSGLTANTTYSYYVSAFDAAGNNSAPCPAVSVTTSTLPVSNVSEHKTASTDSLQPGYDPSYGNDGSMSTMWCAADGNPNHWWKVDLGTCYNLVKSEVTWQFGQKQYKYKIEVSQDNVNWYVKVDKTNNTNTDIKQTDNFSADSVRYVRITVTGVPSECWAAFYEFKVFGSASANTDSQAPSAPSILNAYPVSTTQINLYWTPSSDNVGVTGYKIYRDDKQVGTVLNNTAYNDTGLVPGKAYTYKVSAYDAAGNNSPKSPSVRAATMSPVVTNLAFNKTAFSDSQQSNNTAPKGNDGSLSTRWCAADGNKNHWWTVDLGAKYNLTGTEVTWEFGDKAYGYKIEVSDNNANWTVKVDKTHNSKKNQTQKDDFSATSARYVRITVTGLPSGCWASFYEFKVFGYPV